MEEYLREEKGSSNKRPRVRIDLSNKWSTTGISIGPNNVFLIQRIWWRGSNRYTNLFTGDTKVKGGVGETEDCLMLQEDTERFYDWSKEWDVNFNVKNCKATDVGKGKKTPNLKY